MIDVATVGPNRATTATATIIGDSSDTDAAARTRLGATARSRPGEDHIDMRVTLPAATSNDSTA